jgi:hypothetical protein
MTGVVMKNIRKAFAGLVLAAVSVGAVGAVSAAADDHDSDQAGCRWVRRIGLVCDTPLDTITL